MLVRRCPISDGPHGTLKMRQGWRDLRPVGFAAGGAPSFTRTNNVFRDYAIAGQVDMDHRADLGKSSVHVDILNRNALLLSQALGEPVSVVQSHLSRLLQKHGVEW